MSSAPDPAPDLDPRLVERVGAICLSLPEAYEHDAWVGVSWRIRSGTFAHLFHVDPSRRPALSRAAGGLDRADVVTFRSAGEELAALVHSGPPFYKPDWSPHVVGLVLTADVDWGEVAELLTESYCLLAPRKLARLVPRPPT